MPQKGSKVTLKHIAIFIVGGAVVSLISALSERGHSGLAGILVFVPAISVVSYVIIGQNSGPIALREVVKYSWIGIPPLIVFMACLFLLLGLVRYELSLLLSFLAWAVTSALLVTVSNAS